MGLTGKLKRLAAETARAKGEGEPGEGDPVLLGAGNVAYRMESLVRRRRNASLAGQHRDTQRLDKEIMVLRAALGLPKLPPEEVVRTHTTSRDPTNGENLVIASEDGPDACRMMHVRNSRTPWAVFGPNNSRWMFATEEEARTKLSQMRGSVATAGDEVTEDLDDAKDAIGDAERRLKEDASDVSWMRRVTARTFAEVDRRLDSRGYEYASRVEGAVTVHEWRGFRGPQPDRVELRMLGRDWVASIARNGHRVDGLSFREGASDDVARGLPPQMTATHWDGRLDVATRQAYARDLARFAAQA